MEWLTPVLSALAAAGATIIGAYFVFRGKKAETDAAEAEVEAGAADAFLKGQTAFQAYVDGVVQQRVTAAVEELQQKVAQMSLDMRAMRDESHEMNDAIRARETQLWLWNIRNRQGPMPGLPAPILEKLGIAHLASGEDPAPPTQVTPGSSS